MKKARQTAGLLLFYTVLVCQLRYHIVHAFAYLYPDGAQCRDALPRDGRHHYAERNARPCRGFGRLARTGTHPTPIFFFSILLSI